MKKLDNIVVQEKLQVGIKHIKRNHPQCEICQGRIGRACIVEVDNRKYWCCASCYKIYSVLIMMARFGILFDPNSENLEWVEMERSAWVENV